MKLHTVLRENGPHGSAMVDYIDGSEVDRDAAVAHALMRAMDEAEACWDADDILLRADELMREWGFEQDRVG